MEQALNVRKPCNHNWKAALNAEESKEPMSNAKKLADLREAQGHVEALERLHDIHPEAPYICDAEALELGMAIADLESKTSSGRKALNQWN